MTFDTAEETLGSLFEKSSHVLFVCLSINHQGISLHSQDYERYKNAEIQATCNNKQH